MENNRYLYGTVGVLDRGPDMHPEAWEAAIKQITARKGPMTALMDSMGKESTDSRIYHWPEMDAYTGFGAVAGVYTEPGLGTPYASGGADGQALYFKVAPNLARQIVRNQQFTIWRESTGEFRRFLCTNMEVHDATTASVAGILRQPDTDDLLAERDLQIMIGSTAMPEAAKLPDPVGVEPKFYKNIVQKHAASWQASEEEIKEKQRINPNWEALQRQKCLERFQENKERAFLFGKYREGIGENGMQQNETDGILTVVENEVPEQVWNYSTDEDPAVAGKTFLQGFLPYWQERYEMLCRFGEAEEKIGLCSGWAVVKLNQLFSSYMNYNVSQPATVYGIRCYRVVTPHQPLLLIEHPLLTQFAPARTLLFIYERHLVNERELIPMRYIAHDDLKNPKNGFEHIAAVKEGYEQTSGLRYSNLRAMGIFRGVGLDNGVGAGG